MLLDFLQYEFLTRALMAGMLIGLLAPIVGLFLVVRRFSLLADTLSHVSLLGVALALFFKLPLFLGALAGSLLGGVGMEWLRRSGRVMNEAVLALFLSGSLAAALVFLASVQGVNLSLFSYLFGSITTVSEFDLWWLLALVLLVIIFLILTYRKLFLVALDEDLEGLGIAVDEALEQAAAFLLLDREERLQRPADRGRRQPRLAQLPTCEHPALTLGGRDRSRRAAARHREHHDAVVVVEARQVGRLRPHQDWQLFGINTEHDYSFSFSPHNQQQKGPRIFEGL